VNIVLTLFLANHVYSGTKLIKTKPPVFVLSDSLILKIQDVNLVTAGAKPVKTQPTFA
jgi:hypothetical protein